MSENKKKDNYTYLLNYYKISVLQDRLIYWCKKINKVLEQAGIEEKVHINNRILSYFICNYFADIVRLKDFHPVEKANIIKITSYSVFWFLRGHPVQIIGEVADKDLYINEKIAVTVIISVITGNTEIKNEQRLLDFAKHLLYHFKYRHYTAQTIELMIDGFLTGRDFH